MEETYSVNEEIIDTNIEEVENKVKKPVFPIVAFVFSTILTLVCIAAEVFAAYIGVETIRILYAPSENLEGIGLIVLIPVLLIIMAAIICVSIVSFSFSLSSIIVFKRKYKTFKSVGFNVVSILSIVLLAICNLANLAAFLAIVLHEVI